MSLTSWTWDRANSQQVNERHAGGQGCLSEGSSQAEETGWQLWWLYTCNGHTGWGLLAMEQLCKKGSGFHADRLNKSAESEEGQLWSGITNSAACRWREVTAPLTTVKLHRISLSWDDGTHGLQGETGGASFSQPGEEGRWSGNRGICSSVTEQVASAYLMCLTQLDPTLSATNSTVLRREGGWLWKKACSNSTWSREKCHNWLERSSQILLFSSQEWTELPYVIELKGRQFAYTRIFCYSNTQHLYRIHLPYFFFLTWSSSPVFMKLQKQMTSKEKNGRVLAAPMQFLSSVECIAKI